MYYAKSMDDIYVVGICRSETAFANGITENEVRQIEQMFLATPTAPSGHTYKLRADTLEWELVELPPIEPEPYEPTVEDKAEAYDILMGVNASAET